jgi:hypothetical protein
MKRILLSLFVANALFGFTPINKPLHAKIETAVGCKYGQCQATAKSSGNQCKRCVSKKDDKYCSQHK